MERSIITTCESQSERRGQGWKGDWLWKSSAGCHVDKTSDALTVVGLETFRDNAIDTSRHNYVPAIEENEE